MGSTGLKYSLASYGIPATQPGGFTIFEATGILKDLEYMAFSALFQFPESEMVMHQDEEVWKIDRLHRSVNGESYHYLSITRIIGGPLDQDHRSTYYALSIVFETTFIPIAQELKKLLQSNEGIVKKQWQHKKSALKRTPLTAQKNLLAKDALSHKAEYASFYKTKREIKELLEFALITSLKRYWLVPSNKKIASLETLDKALRVQWMKQSQERIDFRKTSIPKLEATFNEAFSLQWTTELQKAIEKELTECYNRIQRDTSFTSERVEKEVHQYLKETVNQDWGYTQIQGSRWFTVFRYLDASEEKLRALKKAVWNRLENRIKTFCLQQFSKGELWLSIEQSPQTKALFQSFQTELYEDFKAQLFSSLINGLEEEVGGSSKAQTLFDNRYQERLDTQHQHIKKFIHQEVHPRATNWIQTNYEVISKDGIQSQLHAIGAQFKSQLQDWIEEEIQEIPQLVPEPRHLESIWLTLKQGISRTILIFALVICSFLLILLCVMVFFDMIIFR